jgi:2,3-bisphosphoglycerate-independent phosphoglycerate mutase
MVSGVGEKATDAVKAIKESYKKQVEENPDKPGSDERIEPIIMVDENDEPVATIKDGDSAIIFNFRADRVRQISRALGRDVFEGFEREQIKDLVLVTMTEYDEEFDFPVAFPPERLTKIFGEVVSEMGLNQLRIAETEKYAHVTYFFNGGEETPFKNEDRALIPSPKVATYNLKPEMSAYEVTEELIKRIESDKYDVIICNYANADMVGHTGVIEAAIKAVQVVDECQQKVVDVVLAKGGVVLLTSDHGNSDQMIDPETGGPFTAHTTFPVPFVITGLKEDIELKEGALCDIAPTILDIMGIDQPEEMTGQSVIVK